jgi:serine/threonine protein kinase
MNAERFKQIDEILDAVWAVPEQDREAFLSEKINGNEDLRREVFSILSANEGFDDFLDKSAFDVAARNLADEQAAAVNAILIGQKIGTYKIERQIGAGGMGEIYLAQDEKLRRQVALKILPAEYTSNDERVNRFELEARAISALNHPNIVTIYDVGNADGINFIATEYVEGKTLRELIGGNLKLKDILDVILQICDALAAAHSHGIIHRDIKPENIMLRPDGYVKILDFGLAKLTEIDSNTLRKSNATAKGVIIGTPAYMSPEQVADENVDDRTDLWSIGVVLYELLTNVNPFKKENRQATFQAILSGVPPLASSLNAEVSPELDQIVLRALEKDADLSYQTASDLRADLKRIKREFDSSPSTRSGKILTKGRSDAKTRRIVLIFASAFLLLALTGGWLFFFRSKTDQNQVADLPPDWNGATVTQITTQPGAEFFPSLAPDGKSLIYASRERGNWDIYWRRSDGKNVVNLTEDSDENDTQPAFSPDGNSIAFRSEREPRGVYLMEPTGENPRHLSDVGYNPAWSPDGKELVVSSDRFSEPQTRRLIPSPLWIINVATGVRRQLFAGDAVQPSWSPGGGRIAFWALHAGSGRRDIWTITTNGAAPVQVTNDEALDWNPIWSPDGKFLYFASNRGGSMNFWRVPIDQTSGKLLGEAEAVTTPSTYSQHLNFSQNGKLMAYVQKSETVNLYQRDWDAAQEKIVGKEKAITQGGRFISSPDLSPDGVWFVYSSQGEKQEDLFLLGKDGTTRQLTNDGFNDRAPRWSPDGNRIAFYSDRSGRFEAWLINADGEGLHQITYTAGQPVIYPLWSPDGSRILFKQREEMPFIVDVNKNWHEQTPQQLPKLAGATATMNFWVSSWSPDGGKLLGTWTDRATGRVSIYFYDFGTQQYTELTDRNEFRESFGTMRFVDNQRIFYKQNNVIYLLDGETKKSKEIFRSEDEAINNYSIAPDNSTFYYTLSKIEANIWLLAIE